MLKLLAIFVVYTMCNLCDYVFQINLIMTEYSFLVNKCVTYCKIIHIIFMNKLKYNFTEVSICCPPRGQLQHLTLSLNLTFNIRNGFYTLK